MTSVQPDPAVPVNVTADVADAVTGLAAVDAQSEPDWKAEAAKWKETSLKIEARANSAAAEAKANASAAARLREIEDRDLSELQRAQRQVEELSARAAAAERAQLRSSVALEKGLPPQIVGALVGETAEELTAHAEALLAWRGSAAPAVAPQPRPDGSQGAQATSQASIDDARYADWASKVFPGRQ